MVQAHAGPLGLGLIRCGLFGEDCMQEYARLPGIRLAAAANATYPNARRVT